MASYKSLQMGFVHKGQYLLRKLKVYHINIINLLKLMKARNLGRLELLAWINEVTESDYPKVELCSDAIAFC